MAALGGISLDVAVAEQAFFGGLPIPSGQADDHDVNVRHAAKRRCPTRMCVSEADFKVVAIEQDGPELRHCSPLRDGIRGDESDAGLRPPQIFTSLYEPCRHVSSVPPLPPSWAMAAHLRPLFVTLVLGASDGGLPRT